MAWQGDYYYRKRRQGNRVASEYVGSGYLADLASEQDKRERLQAKAQRELFRRQATEQDNIDAMVDMVGVVYSALVDAVMLVNGYHQHKREWRMKRDRGNQGVNAEGSEGTAGADTGS